jgi:ribosomal protein L11 methyltransferase
MESTAGLALTLHSDGQINLLKTEMEYTKLSCCITPDSEINRELAVAELGNLGFESFTETEEIVEAYIPSKDFSPELMESEQIRENPYFKLDYSVEVIPDQNWNEVWEKNYFQPLLIEEKCLIRAPFHNEYPTAEYEIIIEPKMAFGTGNHETTYLMIAAILNQNTKGKTILDMGCGTGILGILASMKGAASVTAIDIDEWAFNNVNENTELNNIHNLKAELGGAELLRNRKFDIIYANIQRNVLLQDMEFYAAALNQGGEIIMSGFYSEDIKVIREKAEDCGLQYCDDNLRSNWCAARFTLQ